VAGEDRRRPLVVVFDVNETLFSLDVVGDALEAAGLPGHALDLWSARVLRDGFALAASGSPRGYDDIAAPHLARILRSFALRDDDGSVERIMDAFTGLETFEDTRPALQQVRDAGMRALAYTNGDATSTRALADHAGLDGLLERCYDVAQFATWKPRRDAYDALASELGLDPDDIALVSVHSWDVHGAQAAGWTGAWVSRLEGQHVDAMTPPHVSGQLLTDAVELLAALPA
jgi:2-haloacid dehalogenase